MKLFTSFSRYRCFYRTVAFIGIFATMQMFDMAQANPDYVMSDFESIPISIQEESATPQVQINASNDHQLFFKAYNDYGDLDDDGYPETTYKHSVDYYGYFDSDKCYSYSTTNKRFEPKSVTTDKYCTPGDDEWSGNFLNWASMTRIDAIRKILFGGHRRVDTKNDTVLERAFLPPDIHAFAKYYNRTDLPKLTPFFSSITATKKDSNSSLAIGFGRKTFEVDDVEGWNRVGDYVEAIDKSNADNFMAGTVLTIDTVEDEITVNVTSIGGAGTISSWDFVNKTIDPVVKKSATSRSVGTGTKTFYITVSSESEDSPEEWNVNGDYVEIASRADSRNYMRGWVTGIDDGDNKLTVDVKVKGGSGTFTDWDITNLTRTGVTFCNVNYTSETVFSENVTDANPPLIRTAEGNYAFWDAGEVHQCLWEDEDPGDRGKNYNNPEYSGFTAAQDNPYKSVGLGEKDYVAKVQVCVDLDGDGKYTSADGSENCKQYKHGNYKPIGLLQEYGDTDRLLFGMIAGTYGKSTSGGDMIMPLFFKNDGINNMCREVNLGRDCDDDGVVDDLVDANHAEGDGTFKKVFTFVGGPVGKQDAEGVVNSWSIYRIKGYKYGSWTYADNSGDKCKLGINFFGDSSSSECQNWGNPYAEIYLTALRHWVGENAPVDYQAQDNAKGVFEGLNYLNGVWEDPLTEDNYCAPLNIINFNSSTISADTAFVKKDDELDSTNQGIVKDLDSPFSSIELTNQIGQAEGIHDAGTTWFVGETATDGSRTCTAKKVEKFGEVRGLCPEGPDQRGGFRIAGMAWYAHTNDIRPDTLQAGHDLKGIQSVDNYSVRLATGNPVVEIPVPGTENDPEPELVTLIPACITQDKSYYGCTLVDFKIITPHYTEGNVGKGKFMAIWEDSLQGNDYDLDAGGIYEYEITDSTIKVTTAVTLENLGYAIGHGYVISGTTKDGLHIHSGTNSFDYTDSTGVDSCKDCYGLMDGGSASSYTYTLGESGGKQLEDPLWYAAKWGGFEDKNGNKMPDLTEEWDSTINKTGEEGSDGIPDNYFFASHPQQLEDSLRSTFDAILKRTSSGTAAAVVSSNVRGEGALYQAFFEPLKREEGKSTNWIGTLQALWLDSYGYTRQDCTYPRGYDTATDTCIPPTGDCVADGILDNYCVDQVVETYYDEFEERTRVKVFNSTDPDEFEAYSMAGVVKAYTAGSVVMEPNSLQGIASFDSGTDTLTLSPFHINGTVTAYDPLTGTVTIDVTAGDWSGPAGDSANQWKIKNSTTLITGGSSDSIVFATNSALSFDVLPVGDWITVGDTLQLTTKMPVGRLGEAFDNWNVRCIDGSATGTVVNVNIYLKNDGDTSFIVEDQSGDFSSCTMAQITSYDMVGEEGDAYNEWSVTNLETIYGRGTSTNSLTLGNTGTRSFTVSPTDSWLSVGDRISVSNYSFTVVELNELGYLWNAREKLYLDSVTDAQLETNRLYGTDLSSGTPASAGRFITTWVDLDLDGDIDAGEYRDFIPNMFSVATDPVKYGFFDADDQNEAIDIVKYIRGIEVAGTRNRTVKYASSDAGENVMRLGDIIDSTPTVVSSPQEGFNLLYKDATYTEFRKKYQNRRVVVYSGGNDGLFHAFNGGFYNTVTVNGKKTVEYAVAGKNQATGQDAVQHPLGSELWAYAPYNLLPHLQWLKDPDYEVSHVYYMNAKPRVFDANIFTPDPTHPEGWGTVLVVGMNLGGGPLEIDTNSDDPGNASDNTTLRSAYAVFDITNPEQAPVLLGEFQVPDGSYTTVYPAVLAFRDPVQDASGALCTDALSSCVNKWYLQFGTGPNDHVNYTSDQTTKMYLLDLAQLTTSAVALPDLTATVPAGCSVQAITPSKNVIACDTAVANSFMGTPVVVDWNLDFYADTNFFGIAGDATADKGQIWRMSFSDNDTTTTTDHETNTWASPALFYLTDQPVISQPVPALDDNNNKWVFFGTGRYYASADKTSITTQSLYGIKDADDGLAVSSATLLDVSDTEVYTDRSLKDAPVSVSGDTLTTFDEIEDEIDNHAGGWKLDFPPITGTVGVAPATRNFTRSALLGGVLFTSVFQPSEDPCAGEGLSRLYGLYYKTGTAFPGPAILGAEVETEGGELKYRSKKFLDLGVGVATAPAIHSGAGSGEKGVSVFTQLSTGDIVRETGDTVESVRTGKTSWSDK
jgi:Tfp pilus tip-associated adhesin PilY1